MQKQTSKPSIRAALSARSKGILHVQMKDQTYLKRK